MSSGLRDKQTIFTRQSKAKRRFIHYNNKILYKNLSKREKTEHNTTVVFGGDNTTMTLTTKKTRLALDMDKPFKKM